MLNILEIRKKDFYEDCLISFGVNYKVFVYTPLFHFNFHVISAITDICFSTLSYAQLPVITSATCLGSLPPHSRTFLYLHSSNDWLAREGTCVQLVVTILGTRWLYWGRILDTDYVTALRYLVRDDTEYWLCDFTKMSCEVEYWNLSMWLYWDILWGWIILDKDYDGNTKT